MEHRRYGTFFFGAQDIPCYFMLTCHKENAGDDHYTDWHPNIEILYFVQGNGTVFCGNRTVSVRAGDVFIVNAFLPHSIESKQEIQYYCMIPDSGFCQENRLDTDNIRFQPLIRDDARLNKMLEDIAAEYKENNTHFHDAAIRADILQCLVYLARSYGRPFRRMTHKTAQINENIHLALGFMLSNLQRKLSLDEIAHEAGMSKYHFSREFKNAVGITPITFINKTRCENAQHLLMTGTYTLKEIAEASGFENVTYFTRNFKRYIGCTPTDFIKREKTARNY